MKMRFLPDEAINDHSEDILGLGEFVELIQTSIYHTETPFVYGILGDWGSGKTSAMRLLANSLSENLDNRTHPFVPIWFDAWKYENEANIVYPLLYAIKRNYEDQVGLLAEAKEFFNRFLQVVTACVLVLTDVGVRVATKPFTGKPLQLDEIEKQLNAVKEHPDQLERVLSTWADQVTELHDAFEALLDIYATDLARLESHLSKEEIRFVILIDDLDRCLPETTIAILESIKNYLAVKNCIFILGLNPRVIYQGIRIKYQGLDINGQEYLEKILNYSFYVPEPELASIAEFGTSQIERLVLEDAKREQYKEYFKEFGQVLSKCNFNNPRKIKRILNRYLFFISKYENSLARYNNLNTVRLIVLAEYFPHLFQLFLKDANQVKAALSKVGQSDFDIERFESRFGLSITPIYPQLSRMSNLFKLTQPMNNTEADITEQAQAVFRITRLI